MNAWQPATWMRTTPSVGVLLVFAVAAAPLAGLFAGLPLGREELDRLRELATGAGLLPTTLRTLGVALGAGLLASLLAAPAAIVATRRGPLLRYPVILLGLVPLVVPPFVGASALRELAAGTGLSALIEFAGGTAALILVYAVHHVPLVLGGLALGLSASDRDLEDSARSLGAGRVRRWRRVILPLAAPGYLFGLGLMLLRVLEDAGTPLALGVDGMLAPQLLYRLDGPQPDPLLPVTALVLVGICGLVVTACWSALVPGHRLTGPFPQALQTRPRKVPGTVFALGLLTVGAMAPAGLTLTWLGGFPDVLAALSTQPGYPALAPTLGLATVVGVLSALTGVLLGAVAGGNGLCQSVGRVAVMALLAIPGVVLAAAYLRLGQASGISGDTGMIGLALALAVKQAPLALYLLRLRLAAIDPALADVADNAGVRRPGTLGRLLGGSLTIVALLGAAAAVGELSMALVLLDDPQALLSLSVFDGARDATAARGPVTTLVMLLTGTLGMAALILARGDGRRRPVHHVMQPRPSVEGA